MGLPVVGEELERSPLDRRHGNPVSSRNIPETSNGRTGFVVIGCAVLPPKEEP